MVTALTTSVFCQTDQNDGKYINGQQTAEFGNSRWGKWACTLCVLHSQHLQ